VAKGGFRLAVKNMKAKRNLRKLFARIVTGIIVFIMVGGILLATLLSRL
jgi:hypothetical protein